MAMAAAARDVEQGHRQAPQQDNPQAVDGYKAQTGFFIFECIQKTILVIQLLSIPFEWPEELNLPYNAYDGFFEGLTFFRLNIRQYAFVVLFLVLCGTTVLFGLLAFISQIEDCGMEACLDCLTDDQWVIINDLLLYGVLFIPMIKFCLEMFNCTDGVLRKAPDVDCWEGLHVVLFVVAILCLITMAIHGTILALHRNRVEHYPGHPGRMRKSVQHFETKVLVFRLVVTFFTVYTPSALFTSVLGMVFGLLGLILVIRSLPFIEARYNILRGTEFAVVTWGFFVGVVGTSDDSEDTGSMAFWLFVLGIPAVLAMAMFVFWRLALARPPTAEDYLNPSQNSPARTFNEDVAEKYGQPVSTVHAGRYRSAEALAYELGAQLSVRVDLTVIQLQAEDGFVSAGFGECVNHLIAVVEKNQQLQRFSLTGFPLKSMEQLQNLTQSLVNHGSLTVVEFFNCQLSEQQAYFLQDRLKDNRRITTLNLGENGNIFADAREAMQQRRKNDPACQHLRIMF